MKQTVQEVLQFCENLFTRQKPMLGLYQTLADHFYPERADFLHARNVGAELADYLVDSYPILVRRDLANSFHAMLRDGEWFEISVNGNEPDYNAKRWLEWAGKRQLNMMNVKASGFVRSTKEGDHDYATFGQTVISTEINRQRSGYLYRCWHLRDCAWWDDENGEVCGLARKWSPTKRTLVDYFGKDKLHGNVLHDLHREPFKEINVRHVFMPSAMYGDDQIESKHKYVSLFIDVDNQRLIEEIGLNNKIYTVSRFQTVSGSPYAYSPATVAGLPNARVLQAITHTLLEAGERYARPPVVATQKVIRSDVDLSPDGITWVDDEYDEKMGAALRPIFQDRGGFPLGQDMRQGVVNTLASAFYVDKMSLPDKSNMTAYEVSEFMKQYRRQNLPLFAPMEAEYNGALCENTFELGMAAGFFGSPYDIPDSLRGAEVKFEFKSPLSESEQEKRATQFQIVSGMLAEAVQFDPQAVLNVNFDESLRDAIEGVGVPEKWLNDIKQVVQGRQLALVQQAAMAAAEAGVMPVE